MPLLLSYRKSSDKWLRPPAWDLVLAAFVYSGAIKTAFSSSAKCICRCPAVCAWVDDAEGIGFLQFEEFIYDFRIHGNRELVLTERGYKEVDANEEDG